MSAHIGTNMSGVHRDHVRHVCNLLHGFWVPRAGEMGLGNPPPCDPVCIASGLPQVVSFHRSCMPAVLDRPWPVVS